MAYESKNYEEVHAKGLIRNKENHELFKQGAPKRVAVKLAGPIPGKLDLKSKVSPPENQGNCGSCWDFSITKALRSEFMLGGKDPGTLAFNYLLNNCGPVHEWGCQGGDFDAGQNMLGGRGPWLESEDPYRQREGQCRIGLRVAATAKKWVLVGSGGKPSFQELAEAMHNGGGGHVLSVDVAADSSWSNYSTGIYDRNSSSGINHMINCVGYDMETSVDATGNAVFNASGQPINGDGYLILMNNWGNTWGEEGYMRSRWGMNNVAETAMYFEVDRPAPVPPTPPGPPVPPVPPTPDIQVPTWLYVSAGVVLVVGFAVAFILGRNSK